MTVHLIIHQLDARGLCWREFQHWKHEYELEPYLVAVERAYNMAHTGVTDPEGVLITGVQPHHELPPGARVCECDG